MGFALSLRLGIYNVVATRFKISVYLGRIYERNISFCPLVCQLIRPQAQLTELRNM